MWRFQKWIAEAKGDLPAWTSTPKECVPIVAARCEATDITDLLNALDELAKEKSELPQWDGDTHDDIGRAQELFARILASVPLELRTLVETGLTERSEETRTWLRLALSEAKKT